MAEEKKEAAKPTPAAQPAPPKSETQRAREHSISESTRLSVAYEESLGFKDRDEEKERVIPVIIDTRRRGPLKLRSGLEIKPKTITKVNRAELQALRGLSRNNVCELVIGPFNSAKG